MTLVWAKTPTAACSMSSCAKLFDHEERAFKQEAEITMERVNVVVRFGASEAWMKFL